MKNLKRRQFLELVIYVGISAMILWLIAWSETW